MMDRHWDREILNQYFIPNDVAAICGILVSRNPKSDTWFWFYKKDGQYSVRSGYRLALEYAQKSNEGVSASSNI